MRQRLPPLNALRSFEAAARLRSFRLAAEELHVTAAAIGQAVKTLENQLGTPLFHRRARSIELTEAGLRLLPSLQDGFAAIVKAVAQIVPDEAPHVAVAAPPALAAKWLAPRIPNFLATYPNIDVRVVAGTGISRLRSKGQPATDGDVDMAIRFGRGNYPQCRVERLFPVTLTPVCSPSLLDRQPLAGVGDLARHTLIHNDAYYLGDWQPSWNHWFKVVGGKRTDASRGIRFNNTLLTLHAALEGAGVALGIPPLVQADLAAGRLLAPIPHKAETPFAYYLVSHESGLQSPAAETFRDWLLSQVRNQA